MEEGGLAEGTSGSMSVAEHEAARDYLLDAISRQEYI